MGCTTPLFLPASPTQPPAPNSCSPPPRALAPRRPPPQWRPPPKAHQVAERLGLERAARREQRAVEQRVRPRGHEGHKQVRGVDVCGGRAVLLTASDLPRGRPGAGEGEGQGCSVQGCCAAGTCRQRCSSWCAVGGCAGTQGRGGGGVASGSPTRGLRHRRRRDPAAATNLLSKSKASSAIRPRDELKTCCCQWHQRRRARMHAVWAARAAAAARRARTCSCSRVYVHLLRKGAHSMSSLLTAAN